MQLRVNRKSYRIDGHFAIARGSKTEVRTIETSITTGGRTGHGACVPYGHYGETLDGVEQAVNRLSSWLNEFDDPRQARLAVQDQLPPGAARNAVDCALWDLQAKLAGRRIWDLLDMPPAQPRETAYTISVGPPETMAAKAAANRHHPLLKIKLAGDGDRERIMALHQAVPEARLLLDANEAWTPEIYDALAPDLRGWNVVAIEQPFPADHDGWLDGRPRPVPVIADESVHDRQHLAPLQGRFDIVNIKLDKTGGLTEALALADAARADGFGVMVGCMLAGSRATAPAMILAQQADFVDLDGPLLLAEDDTPPLKVEGSMIYPPDASLWG